MGFSFNDFDEVFDSFHLSSRYGAVEVIEDAYSVPLQSPGETNQL